jgi:hypothetical protein
MQSGGSLASEGGAEEAPGAWRASGACAMTVGPGGHVRSFGMSPLVSDPVGHGPLLSRGPLRHQPPPRFPRPSVLRGAARAAGAPRACGCLCDDGGSWRACPLVGMSPLVPTPSGTGTRLPAGRLRHQPLPRPPCRPEAFWDTVSRHCVHTLCGVLSRSNGTFFFMCHYNVCFRFRTS